MSGQPANVRIDDYTDKWSPQTNETNACQQFSIRVRELSTVCANGDLMQSCGLGA